MDSEMLMMFALMLGGSTTSPTNAVQALIASSDAVPAPGRLLYAIKSSDDRAREADQAQVRVGSQLVQLMRAKQLTAEDLAPYPDLHAAYHRIVPHTPPGSTTPPC